MLIVVVAKRLLPTSAVSLVTKRFARCSEFAEQWPETALAIQRRLPGFLQPIWVLLVIACWFGIMIGGLAIGITAMFYVWKWIGLV